MLNIDIFEIRFDGWSFLLSEQKSQNDKKGGDQYGDMVARAIERSRDVNAE